MIALPSGVRVYLACGHTDMRKGLQGLAMLVQQVPAEDPFNGALYAFRGRRGKHTTFHIQFALRDDCLSLASIIGADVASLAAPTRQRADLHLHDRATRLQPGVAQLDVRSGLLRRHDPWRAPDQSGGSDRISCRSRLAR
jgi:transposase